jgi:hypothetical protein
VISRTLVIALALGAAVFRAAQGAWVEAGGLASLGAGLIVLALARHRPVLRPVAWIAFTLTGLSMIVVLLRGPLG